MKLSQTIYFIFWLTHVTRYCRYIFNMGLTFLGKYCYLINTYKSIFTFHAAASWLSHIRNCLLVWVTLLVTNVTHTNKQFRMSRSCGSAAWKVNIYLYIGMYIISNDFTWQYQTCLVVTPLTQIIYQNNITLQEIFFFRSIYRYLHSPLRFWGRLFKRRLA